MKKFFFFLSLFLFFSFLAKPTLATSFDLIGPTETLVRGQEVKFTINIDTENQSLTSTQIGLTYDTQYLEYLNTIPGNTISAISATTEEDGKVIISGLNQTPYSGSGVFAYVTFKLIAEAPGSTEICTLFSPSTTPTVQPTALPKSGENFHSIFIFTLGVILVLPTLGILVADKMGWFRNK